MNDGERLIGRRLHHERRARREHRVVNRAELVDAAADDPPEVVAQEDFVLNVPAAFVAIVAVRRQRDVEHVAAEVAAEAEHVARADRADVARLDVERLGVEHQRQR
jgi:hypothetical protein